MNIDAFVKIVSLINERVKVELSKLIGDTSAILKKEFRAKRKSLCFV